MLSDDQNQPAPSPEPTLLDNICDAFVKSEATWEMAEYGGAASSVIFYLTAIRQIADKPFDPDVINTADVMVFLEQKVDEASAKLMGPAMARIKHLLNENTPESETLTRDIINQL